MENVNRDYQRGTQGKAIISNRRKEALKRADELLSFKMNFANLDMRKERAEGRGSGHRNGSLAEYHRYDAKERSIEMGERPKRGNVEMEKVSGKLVQAVTDNTTGFNLFLNETGEKMMTMRFYPKSARALNGELLKKIMRAVESYIREADRND